jgi:hypothetical protein
VVPSSTISGARDPTYVLAHSRKTPANLPFVTT